MLLSRQTGLPQTPHAPPSPPAPAFLDLKYRFSKLPTFSSQVLGYVLNGAVFAEHPGWPLGFVGTQSLAIVSAVGACSSRSAALLAGPASPGQRAGRAMRRFQHRPGTLRLRLGCSLLGESRWAVPRFQNKYLCLDS